MNQELLKEIKDLILKQKPEVEIHLVNLLANDILLDIQELGTYHSKYATRPKKKSKSK